VVAQLCVTNGQGYEINNTCPTHASPGSPRLSPLPFPLAHPILAKEIAATQPMRRLMRPLFARHTPFVEKPQRVAKNGTIFVGEGGRPSAEEGCEAREL
jgi:hypothetical protein